MVNKIDYDSIANILDLDNENDVLLCCSALDTSPEIVEAICSLDKVGDSKSFMSVWEDEPGIDPDDPVSVYMGKNFPNQLFIWNNEVVSTNRIK